ncbi:hypothetical protein ACSBRB_04560 [Staphylococcus auricularis]|uniref:Uncharacterized protein n=1 Tax=Staphylococcus auricularis TaxID=29379 RepID=A0AAW7MCJ0_9STAP|nr:hypothetical protein [Staphylococcus auricularis]MDC6327263.1 hypothetical protein [Staphylococcus auricularis]MDN4533023.1 hypothetical protein [Staphylococcus auricularis]
MKALYPNQLQKSSGDKSKRDRTEKEEFGRTAEQEWQEQQK